MSNEAHRRIMAAPLKVLTHDHGYHIPQERMRVMLDIVALSLKGSEATEMWHILEQETPKKDEGL